MSRIEMLLQEIKQATIIGVKRYLTLEEAATYLGISVGTLRNKLKAREVPYHKPAGTLYFDKEELNELMSQCKHEAIQL